jgi:hypothetical protein
MRVPADPGAHIRKGGRVVECAGLEIRCTVSPYRGFESLPFRHRINDLEGSRGSRAKRALAIDGRSLGGRRACGRLVPQEHGGACGLRATRAAAQPARANL